MVERSVTVIADAGPCVCIQRSRAAKHQRIRTGESRIDATGNKGTRTSCNAETLVVVIWFAREINGVGNKSIAKAEGIQSLVISVVGIAAISRSVCAAACVV